MSTHLWNEVRERVFASSTVLAINRDRNRVKETAEIFTPIDLVIEMIQRIGVTRLGPGLTVLDPACGDGQFLIVAKWVKVVFFGMREEEALSEIYGVDLMWDNVQACRSRLGGGTIVLGDALHPHRRVAGQTAEDQAELMRILGQNEELELFT